jgi:hypothetical protein
MKTRIWFILQTIVLTVSSSGQGRVSFNNLFPDMAPVTIRTNQGAFNPSDGPPGAFVGSMYTATLVFVNGTITDQSIFEASNPIWVADTVFYGTTGNGADGAGFFDGALPQVFGQTSLIVTFQIRSWFNGGGQYTSYAQAAAAGHNVGFSVLVPVPVTFPPGPAATLNGLKPFTVGIPEPSSVSLLLLSVVSLSIFRHRLKPLN